MLINKPYDKDTVVSMKLVNGDEVVCRIVEVTTENYVVSKPCTVVPSAKGLGLIQSLFTSDIDKTVEINKQHVVLHSPTVKDVESYYIQTTTGIETIPAGKIIT